MNAQTGSIQARAMLARVSISTWSGAVQDKAAASIVHDNAGAKSDAGTYRKRLVSSAALQSIAETARAARGVLDSVTLPWLDSGQRILPAALFAKARKDMLKFRDEFDSHVRKFLEGYPDHVAEARERLGELFRETDYPAPDEIKERFRFRFDCMPLPDARDFRVAMSESDAEAVRLEIEERVREGAKAAARELAERVRDTVGRMAERLAAFKPGTDGQRATGIFRDSLVDNVRELAEAFDGLNVTADPALRAIGDRIRSTLCEVTAKELREDETSRGVIQAEAAEIVAAVSDFLA